MLESSLGHIQIDDYYPTFEEKLLHLIFSIAQNHVFVDGNKRTAISLGAYFLLINGYPSWIVGDFIEKMEDIVLLLVEKLLTKEECGEYMALIISENPFPELLQMKLISSLIELKRLEEERT
ncbi:type II toxin-antitoxin system death-on-curing family toxin [Enterococcus lactis]|nr:type II toxin-antitoxin system death-on-curing family toxin [Enterococcus lactis]